MSTSIPELALQEAALKTLADAVADQLKAVKADMQEQLESCGASRVDATLSDGTKVATISRSTPKPTAQVVDMDALIAWVRTVAPGEITSRIVTELRPAYQSALLGEMTAAGTARWADPTTGEIHDVPGVEIRPTRRRSHSVLPVDGGREAIAEAWRTGALSHLSLPQISGGAA